MSDVPFSSLPPEVQQQVLDNPTILPPDGIPVILDNPPNKNYLYYVVISICLPLCTAFVFARVYGMFVVLKKPGITDYILVLAYALYVSLCATFYVWAVGHPLFTHQWNIRFRDLIPLLYWFTISTNLFLAHILLIKGNILLEWLRIFCPAGRRDYIYWTSVVLLCINYLYYTAGFIAFNLSCRPHAKIWDKTLDGKCIDSRTLDIFSASLSLVIDIVILLLPQRVIWGLQMNTRRKIGVGSMFAIGIIGIVAAGFRLAATLRYSKTDDVTYVFSELGLWVLAESTSAIIVFCMPVLPRAFAGLGMSNIVTSLKSRFGRSTAKAEGSNAEAPSASKKHKGYTNSRKKGQYSELDEMPLKTFGSANGCADAAIASEQHGGNYTQTGGGRDIAPPT